MKRVVMFSGGVGSWAAARRVADRHGTDDMVLLFADTMIEDEDLYRFLDDASRDIGVPITRIADGRTPQQVMRDKRIIGNARVDPCSLILKRELMRKWRADNCDPEQTITYLGVDWTESHRLGRYRRYAHPWIAEAPMCDAPFLSKAKIIESLRFRGIAPPRLYAAGFVHNNCGGACIKAGQAQWALLLKTYPDRYREWELWEEEMREMLGDYAILRDRRGGATKPLPLRVFRERIEYQADMFDKNEWGGCGCAL